MSVLKAIAYPNEQYQEWPATPDTLALLDLRLKAKNDFIGRLSFTASLHLNPDETARLSPDLIDKLTIEAGYPDSNRIMSFKNSGTVMNSIDDRLQPMVWTPGNPNSIYKTIFTRNRDDQVKVNYKILLDLSKAAGLGLNDTFQDEVNLKINYAGITSCLLAIIMI